MKKQLRELLKVPKEQRIAQYIYNQCREYEVYCECKDRSGVDIFNIEDDEFIKLMSSDELKE